MYKNIFFPYKQSPQNTYRVQTLTIHESIVPEGLATEAVFSDTQKYILMLFC